MVHQNLKVFGRERREHRHVVGVVVGDGAANLSVEATKILKPLHHRPFTVVLIGNIVILHVDLVDRMVVFEHLSLRNRTRRDLVVLNKPQCKYSKSTKSRDSEHQKNRISNFQTHEFIFPENQCFENRDRIHMDHHSECSLRKIARHHIRCRSARIWTFNVTSSTSTNSTSLVFTNLAMI